MTLIPKDLIVKQLSIAYPKLNKAQLYYCMYVHTIQLELIQQNQNGYKLQMYVRQEI